MKAVLTFLILALAIGCGEGNNNGTGAGNGIVAVNIKGAQGLLLADDGETAEIRQLTSAGAVEPVQFTDANGEVADDPTPMITGDKPVGVHNAGPDYVVFVFGGNASNPTTAMLARKSDGAVFLLGDLEEGHQSGFLPIRPFGTFDNREFMQVSNNGNIFFRAVTDDFTRSSIVKLDVSAPNAITGEEITPAAEEALDFTVGAQGDVIYDAYPVEGSGHIRRVAKRLGGYHNLVASTTAYWSDAAGELFHAYQIGSTSDKAIASVTVNGANEVSTSPAGQTSSIVSSGFLLRMPNATYVVNRDTPNIVEVNNPTATPRDIALPLESVTAAAASETYLYVAGQRSGGTNPSTVLRIEPSDTPVILDLYDDGAYDVNNLTVTSDDQVTASALRLFDGKYVVLRIDADMPPPFALTVTEENVPSQTPVLLECIQDCGD